MKCHIRLLTVVVVGLSGVTASNAADYGYGGGPWPPGYGSGNEYGSGPPGYGSGNEYGSRPPGYGSGNEYGSRPPGYGSGSEYGSRPPGYRSGDEYGSRSYGSGYDRNLAPWGAAPYDTLPSGRPSYPPPPTNPWARGGGPDYGTGYGGEPGYGGGPNDYGYGFGAESSQRYPAYGTNRGGWQSYPSERVPDYSEGGRTPEFGVESGPREYSNPGSRRNYGGYGSPPDMEWGRRDYASPRSDSTSGFGDGRGLPPPPSPPGGRYNSSASGVPTGTPDPWEKQDNARGSASSYPEGKNDSESNQPSVEKNVPNQGTAAGTSDTGGYSASWGHPVESGHGLIPSPSDGAPASSMAQESGKVNGEHEQK